MRIGGGAVSIADVTDRNARDLGFVRPFWLNEIRAGRAFHGGTIQGAQVGNSTKFQLFNPAGSGINALIYKVGGTQPSTDRFTLRSHNTALATLLTSFNLLAGGAGPTAEVRHVRDNTAYGTALSYHVVLGNTWHWFHDLWTYELGPGEGLILSPGTTNETHAGEFLWIEETI